MEKRPRHMEMITIETEEDKVLRKELRKEEKAYQRLNRRQDSDSDDELNKIISKTLVTLFSISVVANRKKKLVVHSKIGILFENFNFII